MSKYFQNADSEDFLSDYDNIPSVEGVPDGVWAARVRGWKAGRNHNGTPRVKFSFEILNADCAGAVVTRDYFFTAAAAARSKRFCQSLGIDPRHEVSDYPPLFVEVETQLKDTSDGSPFVEVVSARRVDPPAGEGESGGEGEAAGKLPGAL